MTGPVLHFCGKGGEPRSELGSCQVLVEVSATRHGFPGPAQGSGAPDENLAKAPLPNLSLGKWLPPLTNGAGAAVSLRAVRRYSMRTGLTMCGIIVGCLLTPALAYEWEHWECHEPTYHYSDFVGVGTYWHRLLVNDRISDLAIDRRNGKLYWTYRSTIYRSNPDGSDAEHWAGPFFHEGDLGPGPLHGWTWAMHRFFIGIEGPYMHLSMWVSHGGDTESRFSIKVAFDDWPGDEDTFKLMTDPISLDGVFSPPAPIDVHDYDDSIDDRIEAMAPVQCGFHYALDDITGFFYWVGTGDGVLRACRIADPDVDDGAYRLHTVEYDPEDERPIIDLIAHNDNVYWVTNHHEIFRWKWGEDNDPFTKIIDAQDVANSHFQTAVEPTSLGTLKASQ